MGKLQKDKNWDNNMIFTQKEVFFVEYSQEGSVAFLPQH